MVGQISRIISKLMKATTDPSHHVSADVSEQLLPLFEVLKNQILTITRSIALPELRQPKADQLGRSQVCEIS